MSTTPQSAEIIPPSANASANALFDRGPFPHFQQSLEFFQRSRHAVAVRACLVVLIGWLPLIVLVAINVWNGRPVALSFMRDLGVHSRSLLAAPLFLIVERTCLQRLDRIVQHFLRAGLVRIEDRGAFVKLIASCQRLMNSSGTELLSLLSAYALAAFAIHYVAPATMPAWYFAEGSWKGLSAAAWWYVLISLPLLLMLILGWLIRLLLWGRFLWSVSRMNLKLVSAHPDQCAGLKFLNAELFAFMPLAFTFGIIGAGAIANRILYHHATTYGFKETVIGLLIFVMLLFIGPLLPFCSNLHKEKVRGIYRYGKLANDLGTQFELKWLSEKTTVTPESLAASDFSATTDLYGVVANVYEIKIFPFEARTLMSLCIATLLPFIPVLLMLVPLKVIVKQVASLLFGTQMN